RADRRLPFPDADAPIGASAAGGDADRQLSGAAMARARFLAAAALLATLCSFGSAENLKVYVSADMEGVAGVVTGDQLSPQGFEYERFRGFMTEEVLAAIEG